MTQYTVELGNGEIIHGPSGYDEASAAFDRALQGTQAAGEGAVELVEHTPEGSRRIIGYYSR